MQRLFRGLKLTVRLLYGLKTTPTTFNPHHPFTTASSLRRKQSLIIPCREILYFNCNKANSTRLCRLLRHLLSGACFLSVYNQSTSALYWRGVVREVNWGYLSILMTNNYQECLTWAAFSVYIWTEHYELVFLYKESVQGILQSYVYRSSRVQTLTLFIIYIFF